jgi:hypothetical protein
MWRIQRIWLTSFWLLASGLQISVTTSANAQDPDGIVFHDDYNKALREAKLTKRPIFLEFRCAP